MVGWLIRNAVNGWATCAITQAGFIRVLSQPMVSKAAFTLQEWSLSLVRVLSHPAHRLLAPDFAFADVMTCCTGGVVGHRQITDAYLLTAAMRAGMKLLTFDSGLGTLLASDAERSAHIEVLRWFTHRIASIAAITTLRGRWSGGRCPGCAWPVDMAGCWGRDPAQRAGHIVLPCLASDCRRWARVAAMAGHCAHGGPSPARRLLPPSSPLPRGSASGQTPVVCDSA